MGFRPPRAPTATPQGADTMTAPPPPELPPHAASDPPVDRIPTSSGLPRKRAQEGQLKPHNLGVTAMPKCPFH